MDLSVTSNSSNKTNYKKTKRKKRKNKNSNTGYAIRKKNFKKYHKQFNFECSGPSSCKKFFYPNKKIMSDWYWSNYKKAIEWQDKHKIAHWKGLALALQEQNKYLMQIIHGMNPGMSFENITSTYNNLNQGFNQKRHTEPCNKSLNMQCSDSENETESQTACDDEEFEMSEEMIKFFEQSIKHKMELQKLKEENETKDQEEEVKQIQQNKLKRTEEMQLLYGDAASMIIGMETAVQLSFDKFCDVKSPKYWPNIPLKL